MPNWCENQLEINGSEESIAKIVKATGLDKEKFDFNGVLPMPVGLDITSGSSTNYAYQALFGKWEELINMSWLHDELLLLTQGNLPTTREEFIYLIENEARLYERSRIFQIFNLDEGRQAKFNEENYGHSTWYDWCTSNWGTKWNACDVYVSEVTETSISIDFMTAWSPPVPIAQALCSQFPDIQLSMRYAEIGSYFAGEVTGEVGHSEDIAAEDVKVFYITHFDPEYFDDEDEDDDEDATDTLINALNTNYSV